MWSQAYPHRKPRPNELVDRGGKVSFALVGVVVWIDRLTLFRDEERVEAARPEREALVGENVRGDLDVGSISHDAAQTRCRDEVRRALTHSCTVARARGP